MFVESVQREGGTLVLNASAPKVTCHGAAAAPTVEQQSGAVTETYSVAPTAKVLLQSPDGKQGPAATTEDLAALFDAHRAGKAASGAYGWRGNVFTVRVDAQRTVVLVAQGLSVTP
ncbi:hypothetical protein GCM10023235_03830 [Kitasatospora terrestris]|uniref:Uncharacterized protein n=1 Tax=Kitasatospora terrestris TaxID=258051 RepID=A0ABP9D6Y6_9ACTN